MPGVGTLICVIFILRITDFHVVGLTVTGQHSVKGLVGENVTIPCMLSDVTTPLILEEVQVTWMQKFKDGTEKRIYQFSSNKHISSRPGAHMIDDDIKQGNAALHISQSQISDEGKYTCQVIVSPNDGNAESDLQISVKPQISLPDSLSMDLSYKQSDTVSCDATKFYPELVNLQWTKYIKRSNSRLSLTNICNTPPIRNSDGTFNVTSTLIVSPSETEDGDEYFCSIEHQSLDNKISDSFILHVSRSKSGFIIPIICIFILLSALAFMVFLQFFKKKQPDLVWIVRDTMVFDKEKAAFLLSIHAFRPEKVTINVSLKPINHKDKCQVSWKSTACGKKVAASESSGDPERQDTDRMAMLGNDGQIELKPVMEKSWTRVNKCLCSVLVNINAERDDGAKLTAEIRHSALKSPVCVTQIVRVIRFTPTIEMKIKKDGENVWIVCSTKWTHPEFLQITWMKKTEGKKNEAKLLCIFSEKEPHPPPDFEFNYEIIESNVSYCHTLCSIKVSRNSPEWNKTLFQCKVQHIHTEVTKTAEVFYDNADWDSFEEVGGSQVASL